MILLYAVLLPVGSATLLAGAITVYKNLKTGNTTDGIVVMAATFFACSLLAGLGLFINASEGIHLQPSEEENVTATLVVPDTEIVALWILGFSFVGLLAAMMAAFFLLLDSLD